MNRKLHKTISPVDGSVCAEFELASAAAVDATLDRAVAGQRKWKTVPITERCAIFLRAVAHMVERTDELATELTWQMGRPVAQSPFEIRRGFDERARYMIEVAGEALADIMLEPKEGFRRFIRRQPLGVERIQFVAFTGSVEGGCSVQRAAARRFIGMNLELGGKDPAYVRADAPLESTVTNLVDGAYFNAGQSCCAVERIYVHKDVYREFVERFVALTREYRL